MIAILFSNEDAAVIDKPSGLAAQPGAGVGICALDAVQRDYGWKPYPVHRLDKDTAGCLLLARSPRAAALYGPWFSRERAGARKLYLAVTFGTPAPEAGTIRERVGERGQEAATEYRTLSSVAGFSLVELELGTGRMHQIRLHLASIGCPVAGDDKHGDFARNRLAAKEYGVKRLLLWARLLEIPEIGLRAQASLPPHFAAFAERTGASFPPPGTD